MANNEIKKLGIPAFAETLENKRIWLQQFKMACAALETHPMKQFVLNCDTQAFTTLATIGAFKETGHDGAALSLDQRWAILNEAITAMWETSAAVETTARVEMESTSQAADESVDAFSTRWVRIVARVPGMAINASTIMYVARLHMEIKQCLRATKFASWQEAKTSAAQVEASLLAEKAAEARQPAPAAAAAEEINFAGRGRGGRSGARGGGRPGGADKSKIRCFNCQKLGHFKSECRSKGVGPPAMGGVEDFCSVFPCGEGSVNVVESFVLQSVMVAGQPMRALLDSGASRSLISHHLIPQGLRGRVRASRLVMQTADGSPINVRGEVNVPVVALGKAATISFVVLPQVTHGVILGRDFLSEAGAVLDFGAGAATAVASVASTQTEAAPAAAQAENSNRADVPDGGAAAKEKAKAVPAWKAALPPLPPLVAGKAPPVVIGEMLSREAATRLLALYSCCFAQSADQFGSARVEPLKLRLLRDEVVAVPQFPLSPPDSAEIEATTKLWLSQGRIRPSDSPYAAPSLVVPKEPGGGKRVVINFQRLNELIVVDRQPMPRAQSIFDSLAGCKVFSQFDFQAAYLQIPVDEASRHILSFVTERQQFECCYVPFGLVIAGNKLQRELNKLFAGMEHVRGYADDWLIATATAEEHLEVLTEFLRRVREAGFLLKPSKCRVGVRSVRFLGRIISADGVDVNPEDLKTALDWPRPTGTKELQRFLGMGRWLADHSPCYSSVARRLHERTRRGEWRWTKQEEQDFVAAKRCLADSLRLAFPDFSRPFVLETDACADGFGAVLKQGDRVVRMANRATTTTEKGAAATMLELAAVVWAIEHFHVYLHGSRFTLLTDHKALEWLKTTKHPQRKLAVWALTLAGYDFEVKYKPGPTNVTADALSRRPVAAATDDDSSTAYPPLPTIEELTAAQGLDPTCRDIKAKVAEGATRAVAGFMVDADGVLCKLQHLYNMPTLKPIIPAPLVGRVLAHTHARAGHLAGGTVELTERLFHWGTVKRDAETFAAECQRCQERKSPRGPRQVPSGTVTVSEANELIAMDILSGIPIVNGFCCILVVQDYFTRYAVAVPLKSKACEEVTTALVNAWITPIGAPKRILSDNGGEFAGPQMSALLRRHGMARSLTTPYHPQGDGMVERLNQTLLATLATTVRSATDWPAALPAAVAAHNAHRAAATGHSPHFLMFGRDSPAGNIVQPLEKTQEMRAQERSAALEARKEVATGNKLRQAEAEKKIDAALHHTPAYKLGDLVMVRQLGLRNAPYGKLVGPWVGPCRVLQVMPNRIAYTVRQVKPGRDGKLFTGKVNVMHLKPFHPQSFQAHGHVQTSKPVVPVQPVEQAQAPREAQIIVSQPQPVPAAPAGPVPVPVQFPSTAAIPFPPHVQAPPPQQVQAQQPPLQVPRSEPLMGQQKKTTASGRQVKPVARYQDN